MYTSVEELYPGVKPDKDACTLTLSLTVINVHRGLVGTISLRATDGKFVTTPVTLNDGLVATRPPEPATVSMSEKGSVLMLLTNDVAGSVTTAVAGSAVVQQAVPLTARTQDLNSGQLENELRNMKYEWKIKHRNEAMKNGK